MRELVSRRRVAGAVVLAVIAGFAVGWPALAPDGLAGSDYLSADLPPTWAHPLGTDGLGHDLSVRVAEALRVSLAVAAGAALLAGVVGVLVGAAAAVGGPRADAVLMRVTDAVAAVPHLLATVVVVALFRGSLTAIVVALAVTHWPPVARVVRAEAQKVMASGYVAASRAAGASHAQVVRHHLLPAVAGQAGLAVVLMVPHAVWHESTLSFLGLGLPPDRPSLGTLVALSQPGLLIGRWWPLVFPTAALVAVTVAVAMLGPGRGVGRRVVPGLRRGGLRAGGGVAIDGHVDGGGLVVRDLGVAYRSADGRPAAVVDGVSLQVAPGQVVALTGPSGSGKSSLLDACCGMASAEALVSGRVHTGGGSVGHVPQSAAAAFTATRHVRGQLAETIAAARGRTVGLSDLADRVSDVAPLCRMVGIDPALADRYPHQLSGGQLRRLAVAAALSTCPTVLVADEPTSGLDGDSALAMLSLLRELADLTGLAVLVVTHDHAALTASGAADEILELREGGVRSLRPTGHHDDELVTT